MTNRLWVYKYANGSWENRGIRTAGAKTYAPGGLPHNMFDVDADNDNMYIAVMAGVPQILKMSADLDADAEVTFNPGAGTEVNLMAGDINSGWVWATGDFGSPDKVALTTDGGSYWFAQNEVDWTGVARPILVGPGDDSLLTTSTGLSFWQNRYEDDTIYWIERYIPGEIWAVDRLDINVEETVIGGYWYTDGLVYYSPNSGFQWETVTDGLPTATITTVIALR